MTEPSVREALEVLLSMDFAHRSSPRYASDYRADLLAIFPDQPREIDAALAEFLPAQRAARPGRRLRMPTRAAAAALLVAGIVAIWLVTPHEPLGVVAQRVARAATDGVPIDAGQLATDNARLRAELPSGIATRIAQPRPRTWWDEQLPATRADANGPRLVAPRASVVPPLQFRFESLRSETPLHYIMRLTGESHKRTLEFAAASPKGEVVWSPAQPLSADHYRWSVHLDSEQHPELVAGFAAPTATFTLVDAARKAAIEGNHPMDGTPLAALVRASALLNEALAASALQTLDAQPPEPGDPLHRVYHELRAEVFVALKDRRGFDQARHAAQAASDSSRGSSK